MDELTGRDYITQPSFRLMTDEEMAERARKDSEGICRVVDCELPRYLDGDSLWWVCAKHREEFMRSMGEWDDFGFSEIVTDVFKSDY